MRKSLDLLLNGIEIDISANYRVNDILRSLISSKEQLNSLRFSPAAQITFPLEWSIELSLNQLNSLILKVKIYRR